MRLRCDGEKAKRSASRGRAERNKCGGCVDLPSVVVVAVDVQHLLSLDAEHAVRKARLATPVLSPTCATHRVARKCRKKRSDIPRKDTLGQACFLDTRQRFPSSGTMTKHDGWVGEVAQTVHSIGSCLANPTNQQVHAQGECGGFSCVAYRCRVLSRHSWAKSLP